ncbi:YebC/PmpR family DNA-binding transcriptional regulator [Patescibacteria group bacterium]|nr:YebC/PmpR family DNA-binding transcriptional regulator [Patescibacteria group bacterium]
MSGHSHFSSIKHKKEITDKKRGQIFSKLSREISVVAKEGGGNPETNTKLRLVIEKTKEWNLPKENIERAIKRGTGELAGGKLEEILFEAYGPSGIAIIIEGITDNKNRALSEIKQVLSQNNGKLADTGSVRWLFERKGVIVVNSQFTAKEDLELKVIEAGAEDIHWNDNKKVDIYTKGQDLEKVKANLEKQGIQIESASLDWVAKENVQIGEKDKIGSKKLFETLDELDSVQEIYSNLAS